MSAAADNGWRLRLRALEVRYPAEQRWLRRPRRWARAVDGVSLEIPAGETLALVGESGCGKTTLGRAVLGLVAASAGEIWFRPPEAVRRQAPGLDALLAGRGRDGALDLAALPAAAWKPVRRALGMVFQDPSSSLNPRMRVWRVVAEPLLIHRAGSAAALRARADALLERVGIAPVLGERFPNEFSGGQRQRIGIARALALDPALVVCDEPVSALDVSVKAQILELLLDLQRERGLSYLFISHDLAVVRQIAQRTAVMYAGRLAEVGPTDALFAAPRHPYTRALLAAVPAVDGARAGRLLLRGEPPSPSAPPSGCRFHPRCPEAFARCAAEEPGWYRAGEGAAACFLAEPLS